MSKKFCHSDLEAYLDEALPAAEMTALEDALRRDEKLKQTLTALHARRDEGVHSMGAIWRRHRLSCPSRDELGSYLLGVLKDEVGRYVHFHLEAIGCRFCQANLTDLERLQKEASASIEKRRQKYFQSSAGYLGRR